jgi:hypothetical protein
MESRSGAIALRSADVNGRARQNLSPPSLTPTPHPSPSKGVPGVEVDGLEIGGAGLDDGFHGGSGERCGGDGEELLLGLFAGEVASARAGLRAGNF